MHGYTVLGDKHAVHFFIHNRLSPEKEIRKQKTLPFFEMRIGVHSGYVMAGIIGKSKFAYDNTAEISVYIHPEHQGKGLGKQLMKAVLEQGKQHGLHTVLSRITEGNDKSIYLHNELGFNMVGVLKEVGIKFGRTLDVTMMQKML